MSVSGGKDSTATLLLALKQFPDTTRAVFADTGNEHDMTHEYLEYLEQRLGITITRLRASFEEEIAKKALWVKTKWVEHGVPDEQIEWALEMLHPTGNPFLDLCIWKGRFPSRMAQFCTQELKTRPLTHCQMEVMDETKGPVWSWQGVRRDESLARANAVGFEDMGGFGVYVWRPIVGWTAQETVDFVRSCGLQLNPLYSLGMTRVGCMPCINARKSEIAEIARRFPDHVERIAAWESIVRGASKRLGASFFAAPTKDSRAELRGNNIWSVVKWSHTKRGGKEFDEQYAEEAPMCASAYGLCE